MDLETIKIKYDLKQKIYSVYIVQPLELICVLDGASSIQECYKFLANGEHYDFISKQSAIAFIK